MFPIRELALRRIESFTRALHTQVYRAHAPVTLSVFPAPGRISFADAITGQYRPAQVGEQFGERWATYWFRVEYTLPAEWSGGEVHFRWDSSSEACVFSPDGVPQQALTGWASAGGGLSQPIRTAYRLTNAADAGTAGMFYVEMAANGLFGIEDKRPAPFSQLGLLRLAEVALFDPAAWAFLWDFTVIGELARHLPPEHPRAGQALAAAHEIINRVTVEQPETYANAQPLIDSFMAEPSAGDHRFIALGHAHLDTAWLWPLAESERKAYRTLSTTLRLIKDYPEYRFSFSQAQHYQWLKDQYPTIYAGVKEAVARGQIVPVGGTWIEPDCNIPSGESLVRQFLVGQRFFEAEFGARCIEFWLPDTFGYPAALPTIMQGAGIRYFLTQKLSWNQFNRPHRSTFWWEGLDGSRVLAHFPPANTYNAIATVEEVLMSVRNFRDHDRSRYSLYLFGFGDGGAGPTPEMLERLRRMQNVGGLPSIEIDTPARFFELVEAEMDALPAAAARYSTVRGELYFEYHRGTYTTQAHTKQNNRRAERLLHDLEYAAALAHVLGKAEYPREAIDRLWRVVLLHQFHDILPGSSIRLVYEDADMAYAGALAELEQLRAESLRALYATGDGTGTGDGRYDVYANTLPFPRAELVQGEGEQRYRVADLPAFGIAPLTDAPDAIPPVIAETTSDSFTLENRHLRAVFRTDGRLTSLTRHDAPGQEWISMAEGGGNQFVLYDDHPINWDAWDVDLTSLEQRGAPLAAVRAEWIEQQPERAALRFTYAFGGSTIEQEVSLDGLDGQLHFAHRVDWHERHRWLRNETATPIHAEEAVYETQFGVVKRPTHYNTTYDFARFEVAAQRWGTLVQPGMGLALLNDCKYGYSAYGGTIGLSLLRGTTHPDEESDQGAHTFRFALLPYTGAWWEAGLVEAGLRLNTPVQAVEAMGSVVSDTPSFFTLNPAHGVLDTVKLAEDGDGLIVRVYEPYGAQRQTTLTTPLPVRAVQGCNLLEDNMSEIAFTRTDSGVDIALTLKPFELVTLRLSLA